MRRSWRITEWPFNESDELPNITVLQFSGLRRITESSFLPNQKLTILMFMPDNRVEVDREF